MIQPARAIGWAGHLPDQVVTNADLEHMLDTTDAWIRGRTGIGERRVGGHPPSMAVAAACEAMAMAGCEASTLDLILVATSTNDQHLPAAASQVHDAVGANCGAFDLNAACSGFVYALVTAYGFLATGMKRVLVVGSDAMSRIIDWQDRGTAILFGDGAGALVLEAGGDGGLVTYDMGTDSANSHILYCDVGSKLQMEGREVFKVAVRSVVDSIQRALKSAEMDADDIDVFVPHQANYRIVEAVCSRLGIPCERSVNTLAHTGNTSAGSIPVAIAQAVEQGQINDGDTVLFAGFGAGMSWGSAIVRWST